MKTWGWSHPLLSSQPTGGRHGVIPIRACHRLPRQAGRLGGFLSSLNSSSDGGRPLVVGVPQGEGTLLLSPLQTELPKLLCSKDLKRQTCFQNREED